MSFLRFGENLPDPNGTVVPDLFVGVQQLSCPTKRARVSVHNLLPSSTLLGDQFRPLEYRNVLLHGSETHVVMCREVGYRLLAAQRSLDDVAPGRIRQRLEDAVHRDVTQLMYNHLVVR